MADTGDHPSHGSGRRTWAPLTAPLVWLFIYVGVMASGWLVRPFGMQVSAGSGNWMDNIAALFASGPVLLVFWLWLRFYEGRTLDAVGVGRFKAARFGAGILAGAFLVIMVTAAGWALGGYQLNGMGAWYNHLTVTWLVASLLAVAGTIVQATVTETLFRGWMLGTVARQWGGAAAVAFNLIAVALIQGGSAFRGGPEMMIGAINFVLMAWFLSLCALRDGTVWGVCGFHAAWNLAMGWGLGLNVDTGHLNITPVLLDMDTSYDAPAWLTGGGFGPDGSLLMTAAIVVFLLSRLFGGMPRKRSHGRSGEYTGDEIIDH
jgi:membrane protease YdiL (CAAX protease family)